MNVVMEQIGRNFDMSTVNYLGFYTIDDQIITARKGGGWVYHFFIYLFICWSNRMAALYLCYHSTTLCTFKDDISASAICYLWRFTY